MIVFAWSGFPQYAARCIGAFVRSSKEACCIVATRPKIPILGMEELCGCPVYWVSPDEPPDFRKLIGEIPSKLFVDGWFVPSFNCLRNEVVRSGGCVYAMIDNNYRLTIKELIKALRFRMMLKKYYRGYMVPGRSGLKLLRLYGVSSKCVVTGMYSADSSIFNCTTHLPDRDKRVLFVGQLCDRKNVLMLVDVFLSIDTETRKGWKLEICGCGPLKSDIPEDPAVYVHDFVQPEELAEIYKKSRIFVLPSKEEHWGVVVHEAVLSGCYMIVSDRVGAAEDFVCGSNGRTFNPFSRAELERALVSAMKLSKEDLAKAERASINLSFRASLSRFVDGINRLVGNDI